MLLKFCGAAREVTGSNYLLEVAGHRIVIDCGQHQGELESLNAEPFPYAANSVDVVLLTHAHTDHSGRIPKLVKEGFKGKIYATLPTIELTEILWNDSVRLMREDAEWQTAKNARRGLPPVEPLYGQEDADAAKKLFVPVSVDARVDILPGVSVRFRDSGHILGSSTIEMFAQEDGKVLRIVFSGDIGPLNSVMEHAPAEIYDADYVLMESTYGNREHKDNEATREEFQTLMKKLFADKNGKVYIPMFVIDRAQRVMYELALLREKGIGTDIPVYFDSPMGVKATKLYESHMDLMSQEIQAFRRDGGQPFGSDAVTYVSTREESQALNHLKYGVVMAGSGMCNGGRIVHHLKNGIWDENNHVVFVGYQAFGTLGRRIVDGAKTVRICGESINVKAKIHTIGGFSAHADRSDLLRWAERFRMSKPKFFIVHGEPESAESLSSALQTRGFETLVPELWQEVVLSPRAAGQKISEVIAEAKAAPRPDHVEETPVPADPSGAATKSPDAQKKTKSAKGQKKIDAQSTPKIEPKKPSPDRRAVEKLESIGDQMREIYEKAGSGEISADSQPLLDAVAAILDSIIAKSQKS